MNGLADLGTYTVGDFMYGLVIVPTRELILPSDDLSYSAGRATDVLYEDEKSMRSIGQAQQKKR